jgi:HEAT repeat protein
MALLDPKRPDGRAVEPLAAALKDARASVPERARIAALLGRTGAPRATPLLAQLARSTNLELRLAAIDALGALGPAGEDDALLEGLASQDASVRLRAATALASAGGARAREALLSLMSGDEETDRACLLTALGGIVARVPSSDAVEKLGANLRLAAGPERDATLEAIGRAPVAAAMRLLAETARSPEAFDRRAVAMALAGHGPDPAALGVLRGLLNDADASVRAQAVWSLGSVGDASDLARLEARTQDSDRDVSADALAAIARIAARTHSGQGATRLLCPAISGGLAYARVNALAGLRVAGARCPQGIPERRALVDDPSEEVRGAAALAVATRPDADDLSALQACARNDTSVTVASRCKSAPAAPATTSHALVYVFPEGSTEPRPDAGYGALGADGLLRLGRADRRGAFFDPVAPNGFTRLISMTHVGP